MKIALIEPFLAGSHEAWANEYAARSRHRVEIFGLEGRHWKWRMHGGAVTLARRFLESGFQPDLLLATDMLDLTTFLCLTRSFTATTPVAIYFHENQLTYPWSPDDGDPGRERDMHYSFINFASALAADAVLFNSAYHLESFNQELPRFLQAFPDCRETGAAGAIRARSRVLPLGMDLAKCDPYRPPSRAPERPPLVLWNHRWEYDKNPEEFFGVLEVLTREGWEFEVAVLGESFRRQPEVFRQAREKLGKRIVKFGFVREFAEYADWLWRADLLPVTSLHDFFGASVVQAMHCECRPLLPRRLAYPEHLPPGEQERFFYEDGEDLARMLRECFSDMEGVRKGGVGGFVARYDWGEMAPVYDRAMEEAAFASAERFPD